MYITSVLLKRRISADAPFRFKEIYPLKLKNYVSGREDTGKKVGCLQEMAVMFACLKEYEFDENKCSKEIKAFTKCAAEFKEATETRKIMEKEGILAPGANKLSSRQLNILLAKYPQPR